MTLSCEPTVDATIVYAALYLIGGFVVIFGVLRIAIYLLKLNHGRHSN
jgi:hypothetical protein